jgi:hypothetical protein
MSRLSLAAMAVVVGEALASGKVRVQAVVAVTFELAD